MPTSNPRISVSISSHGYGHLIQTLAVLKTLIARNKNLALRIQCAHSSELIQAHLSGFSFEHVHVELDGGLVQHDPITVDMPATYQTYSSFHEQFEQTITREARALKDWSADLLISNISSVALAAAARAEIPGIAIASLSWDHIVKAYFNLGAPEPATWYRQLCDAYAQTTLALLPEPALQPGCFHNVQKIPPILLRGQPIENFRQQLGLHREDMRPLIFCSLGGIPTTRLPLEAMHTETDFHWLVDSPQTLNADNIHFLPNLKRWPHRDLIASIDGMVGKPGYCMAVEAVAYNLPLIFTRRGHFPDEDVIATWLNAHARVVEVSNAEWFEGQFAEHLKTLFSINAPPRPTCDGAQVAAAIIERYF